MPSFRLKNNMRTEVPDCKCFASDKLPPEPGSYYTHLGAAASLPDLRKDIEERSGYKGKALRMEKVSTYFYPQRRIRGKKNQEYSKREIYTIS